ncbi:MAG TPA: hypothetical protein VK926_00690 [Gaiellaceae bacterium]|nr:hypothetical protein [Gaiellaceae bacterium]
MSTTCEPGYCPERRGPEHAKPYAALPGGDLDVLLVPETERLLRAVQELKDELQINVELASTAGPRF